jgi:hypothetical protein
MGKTTFALDIARQAAHPPQWCPCRYILSRNECAAARPAYALCGGSRRRVVYSVPGTDSQDSALDHPPGIAASRSAKALLSIIDDQAGNSIVKMRSARSPTQKRARPWAHRCRLPSAHDDVENSYDNYGQSGY